MTQNEYLNQLKRELYKKMKSQEVNSVLEDYRDFFKTGISEGRHEEELCKEFGFPVDVVREICVSQGKNNNLNLLRIISYSAVISFWAIYFIFQNYLLALLPMELVTIHSVLMPFVFLFLYKITNSYFISNEIKIQWVIKILALVPLVCYIFIWFNPLENGITIWEYMFLGFPDEFYNMGAVGSSALNNLNIFYYLGFTGVIFVLLHLHENGITRRYFLVFLFTGLMQSVLGVIKTLYTMSDNALIILYKLSLSLIPFAAGFVFCVLWFLLFPSFKNRINKTDRKGNNV